MAKQIKPRLEEDGLYVSDPKHWELLEDRKVYIYGDKMAHFCIPMDVVRHLKLKHKDKVTIAILHRKEE